MATVDEHAGLLADNKRTDEEYGTAPQPVNTGPRDVVWAVLFLMHLIAIIAVGSFFIQTHLMDESVDAAGTGTGGGTGTEVAPTPAHGGKPHVGNELKQVETGPALKVLGTTTGVSFAVAFMWLLAMKAFPASLIWFGLILQLAILATLCMLCFAAGALVPGVLFGLFLLLWFFVIKTQKERIPFAACLLKEVLTAAFAYPSTIASTVVALVIQIVWAFFWLMSVSAAAKANDKHLNAVVFFLFLISFYWTMQVIKNVVHCGIAGLVGTWCLCGSANMPPNPTAGAFKRATTTSFGSICLGSLVVAFLSALRTMARMARGDDDHPNLCAVCIECFVRCIEDLMQYFNQYAYTQVALYGYSYTEAAKRTWELFKESGVDGIVNDNLTDMAITFGALVTFAVAGLIGGGMTYHYYPHTKEIYIVLGLICGLIGASILLTMCIAASSGVCTVFVIFAQNPYALSNTSPELYNNLQLALRKSYGIIEYR
eukprot:GFYU01004579.1.p1 GENE.GFYU01004579.1~~GFYU01004579.1.p1  ORF type:complete len:485 (-),score=153.92 GFYU01004579.1:260-1714(-)